MTLSYPCPVYAPNPHFIVQKPVFIIPDTTLLHRQNRSNWNHSRFSGVLKTHITWTLVGKVKKKYFIATSLINKKARHITSGLNDNINNSVIKD